MESTPKLGAYLCLLFTVIILTLFHEDVQAATISEDDLSVIAYNDVYDGMAHTAFEVYYSNSKLPNGSFKVWYKKKGADDSEYTFVIPSVKNVADSATWTIAITDNNVEQADVATNSLYSGDYTVTVSKRNLNPLKDEVSIRLSETSAVYNGEKHEPQVKVYSKIGSSTAIWTEGEDYTLTWRLNNDAVDDMVSAGVYVLTVSAGTNGNFTGYFANNTKTFVVNRVELTCELSGNTFDKTYDGTEDVLQSQGLSVALSADSLSKIIEKDRENVELDTQYVRYYYTDANAGAVSIRVSQHKLTGSASGNYTIATYLDTPANIIAADLTDVDVCQTGTLTYTGSQQAAEVNKTATAVNPDVNPVTFLYSDNPDASVDEYSDSLPEFTDAGKYTVYYVAKADNHNTSAKKSFEVTIDKADISTADIGLKSATGTYVKGGQKPEVSVTLNGKEISSENYDISFKNGGSEMAFEDAGMYSGSLTVTGKNNCYSSKSVDFTYTITRAVMQSFSDVTVDIMYTTPEIVFDISSILPEDIGVLTSASASVTSDTGNILGGEPSVNITEAGTELLVTFGLATDSAADKIGSTAVITLTGLTTKNYENGTLRIVITMTAKGTQQEVPAISMKFTLNDDGETYTAVIAKVSGAEYSFDGTDWSDNNTKTDCRPVTQYTGYIRFKETDTAYAGTPASLTLTTEGIAVKTPTAAPGKRDFTESVEVTLTCGTAGADIFYTLDGSEPTRASNIYEEPITVTEDTTIKAFAVKEYLEDSQVMTVVYKKRAEEDDDTYQIIDPSEIIYDSKKGYMSGNLGIITGETGKPSGDGYSHWIHDSRGWWLCYNDGTYPMADWEAGICLEFVNGKWYAFDESGYLMSKGWRKNCVTGKWYYINEDGSMHTGWVMDGGEWYYLNADGTLQIGWMYDPNDSDWYYMGFDGAMYTGWLNDRNKWYYLGFDGAMHKGWLNDRNKWYYMDSVNGNLIQLYEYDG